MSLRTGLFVLLFFGKGLMEPSGGYALFAQKSVSAASEDYLSAVAKPNDNVTILLRRYNLYDYECNINQFFAINGLKEDYRLKAGASYKLPILLYRYNSKSIRSTLGIDDWKTAVRIQNFNNDAQKKKLRTDNFIDSKELWVPWHELNCESATAEALTAVTDEEGEPTVAKGSNTYPIFGKKYQKTPNVSTKLKGHVFYVISGHGGPDVGAQGTRAGHTLCEDEYAYDVALRLARLLLSHGAIVYILVRDPDDGIRDDNYLKCDKDEYAWGNKAIPLDQKERLKQRTDIVNELYKQHLKVGRKEQTLIEIHVDSRTRNHRTDVYFYYRPGSAESKALAVRVHKTFLQKYLKARTGREYNGSVSERGLYTLRETRIPNAVYVELANIRNDWDQQRLVITSNRQALANWMCEALMSK